MRRFVSLGHENIELVSGDNTDTWRLQNGFRDPSIATALMRMSDG